MAGETEVFAHAARDGDGAAFAALYERVAPALIVWVNVRVSGPLRNRQEPDDLLQEIWWLALRDFSSFDREKGRFRSWIFGIANHVFLEVVRRSKSANPAVARDKSLPPELHAELTSVTAAAARHESAMRLVDFARDLTYEDAELFIHCGLEGTMVKDVAPVIGLTVDAVNKRWQRLRVRLKERSIWTEFLRGDGEATP